MRNPLYNLSKVESLDKGQQKRQRLNQLIENVIRFEPDDEFPHLYVFSPSGLGKTFSVTHYLNNADVKNYHVTGNTSLFAFGIQLAVISFLNPEKLPVIIYVDDCDEILKNENNTNCLKNVLDGERKFVYEKSLASQLPHLSDIQTYSLEHFGSNDKMGFVVPTDNMRFIFTSNIQLPTDDEVSLARKKGTSKGVLMAHRNAIRSRCSVPEFNLSPDEQWGWIADVIYNTNCVNISMEEKNRVMEFIWDNWPYLTERSIRTIKKMVAVIKQSPNEYERIWKLDFLKPFNI